MKGPHVEIKVVHPDGRVLEFPSIIALAHHFSLSVYRLRGFLKGRREITSEEYEKLHRLSYEPRSWAYAGKNRKKAVP